MIIVNSSQKWWIREAVEEDMAFVCDSWLESFRKSHAAGPIPRALYRTVYREVIQYVLNRDVTTLVAFNPDVDSQIYGWICSERAQNKPPCVHYAFVKSTFRRWGIATELLLAAGIQPQSRFIFTFKTPAVTTKLKSWTGAKFDPMYVRGDDPHPNNEEA